MTTSPACFIVPPYLLEALSRSGDPQLEARARATLAHDDQVRTERYSPGARQQRPTVAGEPSAHSPGHAAPRRGKADAPVRQIYDAQTGQQLPGDLVRAEGDPASADDAVNEAYDALGDTWALYSEVFSRNSLDDKGLPLLASVHYGKAYDNAFWNGSQMVFGDGDGEIFLGFTRSIDVIGHELTHGVTDYTSGLNYVDQSGALNESISDVFGSLVKQKTLGHSAAQADWLIGAELLAPSVKGTALRSMKAPGTAYDDPRLGKDPQPSHLRDYVQTSSDNGGVHINSGIPNHAFYLVATALGGNAWEDAGLIWYAAITGDIKADCDFATFAQLTTDAAVRAFGAQSRQEQAVREAWSAVGVTDAGSPGEAPPKSEGARSATELATGSATEVSVRRTGGFAGIERERTITLGQLPVSDRDQWQSLLAQPEELSAWARSGRMHPDAFCYGISCADPHVDVVLAEPTLADDVRSLLERTLER